MLTIMVGSREVGDRPSPGTVAETTTRRQREPTGMVGLTRDRPPANRLKQSNVGASIGHSHAIHHALLEAINCQQFLS